jgi:beta-xylosidase
MIAVFASAIMKEARGPWMAINSDFPDPSFVRSTDGTWYAFGSNGNGKRVQVARSTDFNTWTLLNKEALPTLAGWETEIDHWAPDVIRRVCALASLYLSAANLVPRVMVVTSCTIQARLKRW